MLGGIKMIWVFVGSIYIKILLWVREVVRNFMEERYILGNVRIDVGWNF